MKTKTQKNEAKHTPGPWHRNIKPASHYPVVFAGRNTHVAQVLYTRSEMSEQEIEANCDLIAAAPDLLFVVKLESGIYRQEAWAVEYVADLIAAHDGEGDRIPTNPRDVVERLRRAAILRATEGK